MFAPKANSKQKCEKKAPERRTGGAVQKQNFRSNFRSRLQKQTSGAHFRSRLQKRTSGADFRSELQELTSEANFRSILQKQTSGKHSFGFNPFSPKIPIFDYPSPQNMFQKVFMGHSNFNTLKQT